MAQDARRISRHKHGFTKGLLLIILIFGIPACDISKDAPGPTSTPRPQVAAQQRLDVEGQQDMPGVKSAIFSYGVYRDGSIENEPPLAGRHSVNYT